MGRFYARKHCIYRPICRYRLETCSLCIETVHVMTRKHQNGYTLFELVVAAGLFGLLSLLTVISLQDYSLQARISKGLTLAYEVKVAVAEYYSRAGRFPASGNAVSLRPGEEIADDYVKSISIGSTPVNGTITITYRAAGSISEGDTLLLIPLSRAGRIDWVCRSSTLIDNLLPSYCA